MMLSPRAIGCSFLSKLLARVLIVALLVTLLPQPARAASSIDLPKALPSLPRASAATARASAFLLVDVCLAGPVFLAIITDGYSYTAFAELLAHTGTDPQPYAFAGEPLDPNSGFYYNRARWLDPSTGRFLGIDPFEGLDHEPLTLHKYLYASANPPNRTDPSGEMSLISLSITCGIITGLAAASLTAYRGGSARQIVVAGVTVGVVTALAVYYGVPIVEAGIVLGRMLWAYPILLGPLLAGTVGPAQLRTLEKLQGANPKVAAIFADAMAHSGGGGGFTGSLTVLIEAVRRVVPDGKIFPLGELAGNPVLGNTRSGIGIVNLGGITYVVQMRSGQLVQNFGVFD